MTIPQDYYIKEEKTLNHSAFQALLERAFQENHLENFCTEAVISQLEAFTELLTEENAHTNLTAIREIPDIVTKHYADSLLAAHLFPEGAKVIDVGCGGGFPTIPLAIARPDLQITAVDSTQKKIHFVEKAAKTLQLTNVNPICARIEDRSMQIHRESFDVATSRAMARMSVLTELTLPFVKVGGQLIALKGAQGAVEAAEAQKAAALLGGSSIEILSTHLQSTETESRHILVVAMLTPSPKQYPRAYGAIVKKPL